jgi:hypothetical protein
MLGAVDLLFQRWLPYPWANLANSSAVWAVAAFGLGLWVRGPWWRAALAGVVLLVVAVPSYYATATLVQNDDIANLGSTTSVLWMFFAVLAGVLFGVGGSFVYGTSWRRVVGIALPGAVLFAEAVVLIRRAGSAGYERDNAWTAAIEVALGVVAIVAVGRSTGQRLLGLAASVPLAVIGALAFARGGF